jgi:hypothetical protein
MAEYRSSLIDFGVSPILNFNRICNTVDGIYGKVYPRTYIDCGLLLISKAENCRHSTTFGGIPLYTVLTITAKSFMGHMGNSIHDLTYARFYHGLILNF